MAYLPQYENDIYISFARVDNLPDSPTGQGWVDEFHDQLDLELSRRIGRIGAIKISRNPGGDEGFITARKRAIHEAAIFVALVSNGYVISEFCQQELKTFYDAPKRGLGNHSRIFEVYGRRAGTFKRKSSMRWPSAIVMTSGLN